jgi:hypothetical protein
MKVPPLGTRPPPVFCTVWMPAESAEQRHRHSWPRGYRPCQTTIVVLLASVLPVRRINYSSVYNNYCSVWHDYCSMYSSAARLTGMSAVSARPVISPRLCTCAHDRELADSFDKDCIVWTVIYLLSDWFQHLLLLIAAIVNVLNLNVSQFDQLFYERILRTLFCRNVHFLFGRKCGML